ncbi:DUF2529 family protein [Fictibacillus phosphorivorans]|uniref:DUF2529 family protein n=1 Tax=Fictibacillus phosphorivorans TaxID=1221500 RepID=UPI00204092F4|nr:DUF2529 family protein [Fictibacillus phosphorivorans]MCM3718424.1 DUF2529 domain-containing protein [Fictibacillus phosphorivorans]MCM3776048.1 DUF2529 domain-containing protein [Fictibacillus phosphorivorans]
MLKIFSTQVSGLLKAISDKEEQSIEEASRLLAHSVLSEGTVYFKGFGEMEAVVSEALFGENKFRRGSAFVEGSFDELLPVDSVVVASRFLDDEEAVTFCKKIKEHTDCHVILLGGRKKEAENETELDSSVDIVIDSKAVRGLVPLDDGSRIGFPSGLTTLFAYYALFLTTEEILEEYDEE